MAKKKSNGQLWLMLALIAAILIAILLLPGCGGGARKADPLAETTLVAAGDEAPDFTVEMIGGDSLRLSALRGKVVLLIFWATWGPPCREELTRVQRDIVDRFAGRDFVFLPVSRGETRSEVEEFRRRTGYGFAMGLDPEQRIYDRYATNYIPRNFLIGKDGKVVEATIGYEPEEFDALIRTIEQTLEK